MAKHALLEHGELVKGALVCLLSNLHRSAEVKGPEFRVQGARTST